MKPTRLQPPQSARTLPYIALVVGVLSLGFSAIFVRWANAPGSVSSFYRMAIATLLLAWPYFKRRRQFPNRDYYLLVPAVLGGLAFAADLALWSTGVVLGGATTPTLLANTAPVWVAAGAYLFFRERRGRKFWIGLALAVAGSLVILGIDSLRSLEFGLAALFGLLAGLFYAAYFLFTQRGRENLDAISYFWPSALTSTLVLLALALFLGDPLTGYSTFTYINFLALGLVTQVFGYLAMSYALGIFPASIVSPTMVGQPVITAILAYILLNEVLTRWHLLGGVAVLTGVFLVHRYQTSVSR